MRKLLVSVLSSALICQSGWCFGSIELPEDFALRDIIGFEAEVFSISSSAALPLHILKTVFPIEKTGSARHATRQRAPEKKKKPVPPHDGIMLSENAQWSKAQFSKVMTGEEPIFELPLLYAAREKHRYKCRAPDPRFILIFLFLLSYIVVLSRMSLPYAVRHACFLPFTRPQTRPGFFFGAL